MLVISTREFRQNQKAYFDQVDAGVDVLIQRGNNKSYKITSVKEDDTLMSEKEFFAKIDRSLQQYKEGKYTSIKSKKALDKFFESL
ncbi:MAG: type II toxin-antitoxin system Phd/YefM family antitoxin [Bacteroidales bacterium]|jgi:PHD/YefM family antitoxin component YafN of YafNO toxin-antitoxin module|nr:type II toxin-antitoxin system Phd/YefM family antitoxin [Bacteroidales bacterium]